IPQSSRHNFQREASLFYSPSDFSGFFSDLYLSGMNFADTALAEFQPTLCYLFITVLVSALVSPFHIIIVGSYIIVPVFSSFYEMGVDTIFLCFRTCVIG
ncbi:hypothetical protein PHET_11020, partial [Paragonimus heterotremus]